jgi:16S rRNA (guanine966-N2)-methyltransferase
LKTQPKTGQLRIIGGRWRSRKLAFPDVEGLRPTPDRVRETVFNWLQAVVPGASCLDLFAGSGALGLEALSRGAAHTVFVDQDAAAVRCVREHLITLDATDAQVMQADVLAYLQSGRFRHPVPSTDGQVPRAQDAQERPSRDTGASLHGAQCFDVVFIDPPYRHYDLLQICCARLEAGGWLASRAYIYLETESSRNLPPLPPHWKVIRSKKAGQVGYHLASREAPHKP